MRRGIVTAVVLGLTAVVAFLWYSGGRAPTEVPRSAGDGRDEGTRGPDGARPRAPVRTDATPSGAPAPPRAPSVSDALAAAVRAGDKDRARAAAEALRGLLRTDPRAWNDVAGVLRDPTADAALRSALAFVVGTIDDPRTDATLLDALRAEGNPAEVARALLLGLGAMREWSDDAVFELGDSPFGVLGPAGLGITVRRDIESAAARGALVEQFRSDDAAARWAAATALRHSLDDAEALGAFERALTTEPDDRPASVLAEALAVRAKATRSAEERERLVRAALLRAGDETFDATRFRVINDLADVRIPQDVQDALHRLAVSAESPDVRFFALEVLGASASASGADSVERTRGLLVRLLEAGTDPVQRDAAARLLAKMPVDAVAGAALLRAVRADTEWNVRYAALSTIVASKAQGADLALEAAAEDADERVRARAAQLGSGRPAGTK